MSSGVNQDYTITLRGFRSFSANNEAFIVIDGVPSTSALFFALDQDIIDNVNVLKGANGTALHGPRGSNGVVIVNTKKGGKNSEKSYTVNIKTSSEFESYTYLPARQTRYGQVAEIFSILFMRMVHGVQNLMGPQCQVVYRERTDRFASLLMKL